MVQTLQVGHDSQAGIGHFGAVWYVEGAETSGGHAEIYPAVV